MKRVQLQEGSVLSLQVGSIVRGGIVSCYFILLWEQFKTTIKRRSEVFHITAFNSARIIVILITQ